MNRSLVVSIVGAGLIAGLACARDLTLPVETQTPRNVRADALSPSVAIASMGSRVVITGENLDRVDEVLVGGIAVPRERFSTSEDGRSLCFAVGEDSGFDAAALAQVDGRAMPVRLGSAGERQELPTPLRVFSGRAVVEDIAPRSMTPGSIVYLRGRGFDPECLANNRVVLATSDTDCSGAIGDNQCAVLQVEDAPSDSPGDGIDESPPTDPSTGGDTSDGGVEAGARDEGCIRADVFWATEGLVIAVLPDTVPRGRIGLHFWNLAFAEIAATARQPDPCGELPKPRNAPPDGNTGGTGGGDGGSGGDGGFGGVGQGGGGGVGEGGGGGDPEMAAALETDYEDGNWVEVWDDPGVLSAEPAGPYAAGAQITLRGTGTLYFPTSAADATLSPRIQVLIDGFPLPNDPLRPSVQPHVNDDGTIDPGALDVQLPKPPEFGSAPGPHALRVANPHYESAVLLVEIAQ